MKKIVWFLGALLLLSIAFPNGVPTKPVAPVVPVVAAVTDPTIVKLLAEADANDKRRVTGIYSAMKTILERDSKLPETERLLPNTEKVATWHGHTLTAAVDQVNKYPGLDVAIDNVFKAQLGTDDVLPTTPDVVAKLTKSCEIVANSAASK